MYVRISTTASTIKDTAIKVQRIAVVEKGLHRIKTAKVSVSTAPILLWKHYASRHLPNNSGSGSL